MKIVLKGEPKSTSHIYQYTCRGRFPTMYMTKFGKDLKEEYKKQIREQFGGVPFEGDLMVSMKIYFGTKRKSDLDNFNKIVLDSMSEIIYLNDSQIKELHLYKDYDKENPRVEVILDQIAPSS